MSDTPFESDSLDPSRAPSRDDSSDSEWSDDPRSDPSTQRIPAVGTPETGEWTDYDSGLTREDHALIDALRPGTALLIVQRGANAGARFLLDQGEVSSGRGPESDIFLDDVTVSRKHAVFSRDEEHFSVRDVGSLNGTYVNRDRIDTVVLANRDEVQIGKFRLVFHEAKG